MTVKNASMIVKSMMINKICFGFYDGEIHLNVVMI